MSTNRETERDRKAGALDDRIQASDALPATRPRCPSCGREVWVRRIVWGLLPPDAIDPLTQVAGGCALPAEPVPTWTCRLCGDSFGDLRGEAGDGR